MQILRMLAVLALMFVCTALSAGEFATKKVLTLEIAKEIAAAAEANARQHDWSVVITILDDGGNMIYLERMDGAPIGPIEIAVKKAKTAVSFQRPTRDFQDAVGDGNNQLLAADNIIPMQGGLPLSADGDVIGAIGVSGVKGDQDAEIAAAGVAFLEKMLGN
jgi:uncharacterized protein GlcG (DUF336 family)